MEYTQVEVEDKVVHIGGGGKHTHKDRNRSGINRVMTTIRDNN